MKMSESSTSSSTLPISIINLRKRLSSVSWVQCDITSCMKWRRVEKAVADKLTSDTWWECSMNEDPKVNSCNIPEEDLQSFDKLAKRAKLAVFKSELTPGSLVWAKTPGYCSWPALVTEDPANGEIWDGNEEEPDKGYYHVEYLGKSHCHLWVYSKYVELFGEGNATLASKDKGHCDKLSNYQPNSRKRKKTFRHQGVKKERRNYCGGSVNLAINEAMALLPLPPMERLKHCRFVKESEDSNSECHLEQNKTKAQKPAKILTQKASKTKCQKSKKRCSENIFKRTKSLTNTESDDINSWFSERKNTLSFDFLTSLIDVSKEERFFLDISIFKEKEHYFRVNLGKFCLHFGLPEAVSPTVWNDTKINFFDLFLAVDDRGGYEEVTSSRQWSHVYIELTNYPSKGGASKAKSAYKKHLYPFELFIKDKDYSSAIKYVKSRSKSSKQTNTSNRPCPGKYSYETDDESDVDNAEFIQALDELDNLLKTLKEKDGVVPDLCDNDGITLQQCDEEILNAWETHRNLEKYCHPNPTTGSQPGVAVEPGESAQVVPELDFPSISESLTSIGDDMEDEVEMDRNLAMLQQDNEEEWVLQELQALEHGI